MTKRFFYLSALLILPQFVFGMHIAEGFLPIKWAAIWTLLFVPFLFIGIQKLKKQFGKDSKLKLLYAVVGAFVFVLSSLKIPSAAGSSSHLTGIALGAILFGASTMSVIGLIVLLFQALLLAHGGLTTLGANAFSLSVVGAFVAVIIFRCARSTKLSQQVSIFIAALFSDLAIYFCTSFQLAVAFQSDTTPLFESMVKFLSVFAVTQLPLALIEGVLTVFTFRLILQYNKEEIHLINPNFR